MRTWLILLLFGLFVYVILALRFYYRRSAEPTTIIQCDAHSFDPSLLNERQPIVCRGVGDLASVRNLLKVLKSRRTAVEHEQDAAADGEPLGTEVYDSLNMGRWYHHREEPRHVYECADGADQRPLRQSWYDAFMTIQHSGTRNIALFAPSETPRLRRRCDAASDQLFCQSDVTASSDPLFKRAKYAEVILSAGDALILPMQWWISSHCAGKSWSTELAWRSPLHVLHTIARSFV